MTRRVVGRARDALTFVLQIAQSLAVRKAGIREARQDLSALIEDVRKGREIVITDRGRPVARLVPPLPASGAAVPDLSGFRRTMPRLKPALSRSIVRDRGDRL